MSLQILKSITCYIKTSIYIELNRQCKKNRKDFEILVIKFASNSTGRENALKSLARAIILIRLEIIMFFLKRSLPSCQFIFLE